MNANLLGSRQQRTIDELLFGRCYELTFRVYYARRRNRFLAVVDGEQVFDARTQIGLLNMMQHAVANNTTCSAITYSMANANARACWTQPVKDLDTSYCILPSGNVKCWNQPFYVN